NGALPPNGLQSLELAKVVSPTGGQADPRVADIQVQMADGTSFDVNLAGVTTFAQLKAVIEQASRTTATGVIGPTRVSVSVDSGNARIKLRGATLANDKILRVVPLNGSLAAADLRLLPERGANSTLGGLALTSGDLAPQGGAITDDTLLS